MKTKIYDYVEQFLQRNPNLSGMENELLRSVAILSATYRKGCKVLVCGNGGSGADSEHFVGEMMKGFRLKRSLPAEDVQKIHSSCRNDHAEHIIKGLQGALPTISLVSQTALMTAFCNDVEPDMVFAQQVYGYKKPGDVLVAISTSGNSKNVYYAAEVARTFGMEVISLTGCSDSFLSEISTVTLRSSEQETYKVQEDHLKIYHFLCSMVELEMFE